MSNNTMYVDEDQVKHMKTIEFINFVIKNNIPVNIYTADSNMKTNKCRDIIDSQW